MIDERAGREDKSDTAILHPETQLSILMDVKQLVVEAAQPLKRRTANRAVQTKTSI